MQNLRGKQGMRKVGSKYKAVNGEGLQPAGNLLYAPFWFVRGGREDELSFEVKLLPRSSDAMFDETA